MFESLLNYNYFSKIKYFSFLNKTYISGKYFQLYLYKISTGSLLINGRKKEVVSWRPISFEKQKVIQFWQNFKKKNTGNGI